eukprot:scaffold112_cov282-Prasinococcus_capsulatus_cf.AAC.18
MAAAHSHPIGGQSFWKECNINSRITSYAHRAGRTPGRLGPADGGARAPALAPGSSILTCIPIRPKGKWQEMVGEGHAERDSCLLPSLPPALAGGAPPGVGRTLI